jgi:hypothetical protein
MTFGISTILLLSFSCGLDETAAPVKGDQKLLEFVRDAVASNRALLTHGKGKFLAEYRYQGLQKTLVIEQDVVWDGPRILFSMRYIDPDGLISARKLPAVGFDDRRYDRVLYNESEYYWYIPEQAIVRVGKTDPTIFNKVLYNLLPADRWYYISVPTTEGFAIEKLIQPKALQAELIDHYEIERHGNEILWSRHDRNGGCLRITFSTDYNSNPVSFLYTNTSGHAASRKGTYRWKRSGQSSYLTELEISQTKPDQQADMDYVYNLKVLNYSDGRPESGVFSPVRFVNTRPPNTLIQDSVRGLDYRVNSGAQSKQEKADTWNRLIELTKSRGFLLH